MLRIAIIFCLLVGLRASAQPYYPHDREGLSIGIDVGGASADIEGSGKDTGMATAIRAGYGFHDRFVLGYHMHSWWESNDGVTLSFQVHGVGATLYPTGGGLYARATAGFGRVQLDRAFDRFGPASTESGAGGNVGIGYEWRVRKSISMTTGFDFARFEIDTGRISFWMLTVGAHLYH